MGVGIYGLIRDVVAVLPLDDLTAFLDNKMGTKEFFKTLITTIRPSVLMVNIHFVYFNFSVAAYGMCILLCEILWWMHYSFPQDMVKTVRSWPEYHEVLRILRVMVVDVEPIIKILREITLRGNVFNNWKCNGNSLCFVLTRIKFRDGE